MDNFIRGQGAAHKTQEEEEDGGVPQGHSSSADFGTLMESVKYFLGDIDRIVEEGNYYGQQIIGFLSKVSTKIFSRSSRDIRGLI